MAPLVFDRLVEYPLILVLAYLVAPGGLKPLKNRRPGGRLTDIALPAVVFGLTAFLVAGPAEILDSVPGLLAIQLACGLGALACATGLRRPVRFALTAGGVLLASGLAPEPGGQVIDRERDFFGIKKVLDDPRARVHRLLHGSTLHGQQSLDPAGRLEPSTYFTRSGPIGQIFAASEPRLLACQTARVAIVGLGAGTLACYARPGQFWTFYELDPAVIRIAQNQEFFTYLSDCRKRNVALDIVTGDARLRLEQAADQNYQLIVLDVFSSDAIPIHLLTREAFRSYRSKLAEGGLLAFHLSNRYIDLDPVMGMQASAENLVCRVQYDLEMTDEEKRKGKQPTIWAVLARSEADLGTLASDHRWQLPRMRPGARPWTADFSNPASFLVWRSRQFSTRAGTPRAAESQSSLILRTRSVVLSPSSRGQIATLPP